METSEEPLLTFAFREAALNQSDFAGHVHSCAAQQGCYGVFIEPGSVEFHSYSPFLLLEPDAANSVNFAQIVQTAHHGFIRNRSIAEYDFHTGHF